MSKTKIITYLTIITLVLGIPLAIFQLKSPIMNTLEWLTPKSDVPIELEVEPTFISEGQYKDFSIEILLPTKEWQTIGTDFSFDSEEIGKFEKKAFKRGNALLR